MTHDISNLDMEIGSGIAAFETRQFTRAAGLLPPSADAANPRLSTAWPSWRKMGWVGPRTGTSPSAI